MLCSEKSAILHQVGHATVSDAWVGICRSAVFKRTQARACPIQLHRVVFQDTIGDLLNHAGGNACAEYREQRRHQLFHKWSQAGLGRGQRNFNLREENREKPVVC